MSRKVSSFFTIYNAQRVALSFDDVGISTGYSEVLPNEVNIQTLFSKNIPLKAPVVSAAMDTVTESPMAIAIAEQGGIGIIHRGLDPELQAREVERVKFWINGLIPHPITVKDSDTIHEILRRREQKPYRFHSFLVVDENGKLAGLLTRKSFDLCKDPSLRARDIMIKKIITAPEGTTMDDAFEIMSKQDQQISVLPLLAKDGTPAGLYVLSDILRRRSSDSTQNVDERGQLRVGAAVGVDDDERAAMLVAKGVDVLLVQTAHGNHRKVIETVKRLKLNHQIDIAAGNISEPDGAERLIDVGADAIFVGQGSGSICTTRIVSGTGLPQVTAIFNCVTVCEKHSVPVVADGGIRYSGDITKSIVAGAYSVMLGSALAGTTETPGDIIHLHGRPYKAYRGMGSLGAMRDSKASRERDGQPDGGKLVPEGVEAAVPFRGPAKDVIALLLGGLRSGMGTIGAKDINELRSKGDFWFVTAGGVRESHPHDVEITSEAPNYRGR